MSDLIKYKDQHSTKTIMNTLCQSVWKEKIAVHEKKISPFVNDFRSRRARGQAHPVVDFLFTYYSYRPGQLLKWSPGINLALETDLPPKDFANLLNKFDSNHVTVNYDTGNSASLGYNIDEEFDYLTFNSTNFAHL